MKVKMTEERLAQVKKQAREDGFRDGFWAAQRVFKVAEVGSFFYPTEEEVKALEMAQRAIELHETQKQGADQ